MEEKYLVYTGNREKGEVIAKKEKANSPYRKIKYYKGMRMRAGSNKLPLHVAEYIADTYLTVFRLEKIEVNSIDGFVNALTDFVDTFGLTTEQVVQGLNKFAEIITAKNEQKLEPGKDKKNGKKKKP